ncbi:MAG: hypothetical protein P1V97_18180, partial [Planctomycetota bacterium]|nr:hypothetical protein [Planctomycetota bacterium]
MPLHRKGDHTIDCPPIFRCRVHKKALVFSIEFCEEIMDYAEDRVPGNLNDMTRKTLGNRSAYNLPANLSNPK